jgi:hypothetical protein
MKLSALLPKTPKPPMASMKIGKPGSRKPWLANKTSTPRVRGARAGHRMAQLNASSYGDLSLKQIFAQAKPTVAEAPKPPASPKITLEF